jgi:hypothetical protein
MTALRDTIRNYLAADATLMAVLTGGLYAGGEIDRQVTPSAFDVNKEILPCGLVALEVQVPSGPYTQAGAVSSRQFFTVTFWQRTGYASIDAAMDETFVRLHDSKIGVTTKLWTVRHAEDSADLEDPGLLCPMRYARFEAVRLR